MNNQNDGSTDSQLTGKIIDEKIEQIQKMEPFSKTI